ncbi:hypothetical protein FQN55_001630 [Onygenales sp. PD_40]|nr:hypothetical protein FQN55_001630 [Onygenales sp. PD_40]
MNGLNGNAVGKFLSATIELEAVTNWFRFRHATMTYIENQGFPRCHALHIHVDSIYSMEFEQPELRNLVKIPSILKIIDEIRICMWSMWLLRFVRQLIVEACRSIWPLSSSKISRSCEINARIMGLQIG